MSRHNRERRRMAAIAKEHGSVIPDRFRPPHKRITLDVRYKPDGGQHVDINAPGIVIDEICMIFEAALRTAEIERDKQRGKVVSTGGLPLTMQASG